MRWPDVSSVAFWRGILIGVVIFYIVKLLYVWLYP